MAREDYFSIEELYLLLESFDGQDLLGLPSKKDLDLSFVSVWESAKEALVAKSLLHEDGSLTRSGFAVTEVLKDYCTGEALTLINNWYIMRLSDRQASVVIVDTDQGYHVLELGAVSLLDLLQEKIPLLLRTPKEDEQDFLRQDYQLAEGLAQLNKDTSFVIQHYPELMAMRPYQKSAITQLLVGEDDGHLVVYNIPEKQLSRYSQYYFLSIVYTWLGIPFREEDFSE